MVLQEEEEPLTAKREPALVSELLGLPGQEQAVATTSWARMLMPPWRGHKTGGRACRAVVTHRVTKGDFRTRRKPGRTEPSPLVVFSLALRRFPQDGSHLRENNRMADYIRPW